jgi:hypothetical protein
MAVPSFLYGFLDACLPGKLEVAGSRKIKYHGCPLILCFSVTCLPGKLELVGARPLHLAAARPFGRLKAPLGLSLFRFAPQTRIVYFFVLGAISNMTVTRIYKPYSNQVMVLFQGKLISGWFNANTINAIAIISIIKPRILDIRFFMQSTSLSNWNC